MIETWYEKAVLVLMPVLLLIVFAAMGHFIFGLVIILGIVAFAFFISSYLVFDLWREFRHDLRYPWVNNLYLWRPIAAATVGLAIVGVCIALVASTL